MFVPQSAHSVPDDNKKDAKPSAILTFDPVDYPHNCPRCGSPAFEGATKVKCTKSDCECFDSDLQPEDTRSNTIGTPGGGMKTAIGPGTDKDPHTGHPAMADDKLNSKDDKKAHDALKRFDTNFQRKKIDPRKATGLSKDEFQQLGQLLDKAQGYPRGNRPKLVTA